MTDFHDSEMSVLYTNAITENYQEQAFAFALLKEKQRILDEADSTRAASEIDGLPEAVLDLLAAELRAPYYEVDMSLTEKQNIIKDTLKWYRFAGTAKAVKDMLLTLFGAGDIVEWFDFTEGEQTPGLFDVITGEPLTPEGVDRLNLILYRVKNARSHIRNIGSDRTGTVTLNSSCVAWTSQVAISLQAGG